MFDNLVRFQKLFCAKKSYTLVYKNGNSFHIHFIHREKNIKHKHVQGKKRIYVLEKSLITQKMLERTLDKPSINICKL